MLKTDILLHQSVIEQSNALFAKSGDVSVPGIAELIYSAVSPMLYPLAGMRRALGLTVKSPSLPPLLEQTIIEMSLGVRRTYSLLCKQLSDIVGVLPEVMHTDSDIHQEYQFSVVLRSASGNRVAVKFRSATTENFLRGLFQELDLNCFLHVPKIVMQNTRVLTQDFVLRSELKEFPSDQFWYDAGRFVALCDILGINDMHTENVLFDGRRFALIDGETVFQESLKDTDARIDLLRSHVFFPYGYEEDVCSVARARYAEGCLGALLRLVAQRFSLSTVDKLSIISNIQNGYKEYPHIANVSLERFPDHVVVRSVRFPTSAYGEILSACAAHQYFSDRDEFRNSIHGRMDRIWPNQNELNAYDAGVLSRCQIPFRDCLVSREIASRLIRDQSKKIALSISLRLEVLEIATYTALSSIRN